MTANNLFGDHKLAQYLAGRAQPHRTFTLTVARAHGSVEVPAAVRVLSATETGAAHAAAVKYLTDPARGWVREDILGGIGEGLFNLELMTQILARALVDPDAPDLPFAKDADALRAALAEDEIERAFAEYDAFKRERSPFERAKTWEDIERIADDLGKGRISPTNLPRFDAYTLRGILTSLAARAVKQTTESSSGTTPPTDSSPDSSPRSPAPPPEEPDTISFHVLNDSPPPSKP